MADIPGLRPGEAKKGKSQAKKLRRKSDKNPYVLTKGEFGKGLKASGRTGGQNMRAAATRALKKKGVTGEALTAGVQEAVTKRRADRKAISEAGLAPGVAALAKRRLQAQDVNSLRRDAGKGAPTIRIRSREDVMAFRHPKPKKKGAKSMTIKRSGNRQPTPDSISA